jgi:trehalose-phosphatase
MMTLLTTRDHSTSSGLAAGIWERVGTAAHRLLMLDYDGTLVPFRVNRMEPHLAASTRALLRDISQRTRIVIISGRPVAELALMLEGLDVDLVGEHGWEERRHGSHTVRHPLPPDAQAVLEEAWNLARPRPWSDQIERKRTSLMLHTRGLGETEARAFMDDASALWGGLAPGVMDLRRVDGGLELRSRGADKGTAVLRLLAETPRGAFVAYAGDDETDEDAFAALEGRGVSIRVGPEKPSKAMASLADTEEMAAFLERWREVTR